jgi:hypothetical protein
MRDFEEFQADPSRDVAEGDTAQEKRRQTDQNMNNQHFELKNAVLGSGQQLTKLWADDPKQLAKAVFLAGAKSNVFVDTGTANIKELRHVSGTGAASMILPSTAELMDGALFLFKSLVASTGAVTINVYSTKTNKVIDSASMAGILSAGQYALVIYKYESNSFELVDFKKFNSDSKFGSVTTANFQSGAYIPASLPVLFTAVRNGVVSLSVTASFFRAASLGFIYLNFLKNGVSAPPSTQRHFPITPSGAYQSAELLRLAIDVQKGDVFHLSISTGSPVSGDYFAEIKYED